MKHTVCNGLRVSVLARQKIGTVIHLLWEKYAYLGFFEPMVQQKCECVKCSSTELSTMLQATRLKLRIQFGPDPRLASAIWLGAPDFSETS